MTIKCYNYTDMPKGSGTTSLKYWKEKKILSTWNSVPSKIVFQKQRHTRAKSIHE